MHQSQQELLDIARQFDMEIPTMQGQLTCAFVGSWNGGKSYLLNSLIGLPLLPVEPIPTTKTVVRLSRSEDIEPIACIHTETNDILSYSGQAAIDALQNSTKNIPGIDYQAPNLDIPPYVQFIDTPGIDDTDQPASTRAESVAADVVVFVLDPKVSAINQTQINFIQQVILGKVDRNDIFFVFTHDDKIHNEQDRDDLRLRVGSHIGSNWIFFVSNKDQSGIGAFKQAFYAYLGERQVTLLADRSHRHLRQLAEALSNKVKLERTALNQYKNQSVEQREQLLVQICEARRKESNKKNEVRERSRKRLEETLQDLCNLIKQSQEQIDTFIEASQAIQLKQHDYLQQKIKSVLEDQIKPAVESQLESLLKAIQGDVQDGQRYSSDLLADLNIDLPAYNSPIARITAEQFLPVAFLGSIVLFGWLSVPTFLLGFLTLKARDLGLTRYADQIGLLNVALDKVKNKAASGYKQAVKIAVAQTLHSYLNQITEHFRDILEKVTDQALKQVNYVEELENALQRLRGVDDKAIIEREIRLDKADTLLIAINAAPL